MDINLRSQTLGNRFKPAILQCFGDIISAITGNFEPISSVVAQVLEQAATVTASPDGPYEMFDYVVSLREGIADAWGGIIGAMKSSNKTQNPQNRNRPQPPLPALRIGELALQWPGHLPVCL
ncbi:hypothetical protein ARSEF1564_007254 [Beauveria bassiana]